MTAVFLSYFNQPTRAAEDGEIKERFRPFLSTLLGDLQKGLISQAREHSKNNYFLK